MPYWPRLSPALPALLVIVLSIVGSTAVLALIVWVHGTWLSPDSRSYIGAGFNVVQGNGLVLSRYEPRTDSLLFVPLSHYPPFTSLVYGAGVWLGIPLQYIPSIIVLVGWVLLVSGIGALTYRLGAPPLVAAASVVLAVVTSNYWWVFQLMLSEAIFLPLLVWLMVVLVDLPATYAKRTRDVLLAVIFLALLLCTRYVGVLVWLATLIWVAWYLVVQRQVRALVTGVGLLLLAALPFALWMGFNLLQDDQPLGYHLNRSRESLSDGLAAFMEQGMTRMVLPALSFHTKFGCILNV